MTVSALPKGTTFARMAIAKALARGSSAGAAELAAGRWGEGSVPARLLKAAIGAGHTGDDDMGDLRPEYANAATEFIGLVRQQTIIGRLAGLRRVPNNTPILLQTGGTDAAWVREGRPIPVSKMAFERTTMSALKVAAMTVTTDELLQSLDPVAEQLIRADLLRAMVEGSDAAFIDPANAGVADEMPKSVTNGLTAVAATGNFKGDLERLVAAFTGDLSAAYLVAKPELLVQVSGPEFPNVGARGGEISGIPTLASASVPNDGTGNYQMALIDPTGVAYTANDGGAEVKSTQQGSVEMSTTPTNNTVAPTATDHVSMFQTNCIAIAAMMRENWRVARPGSVALLSGIAPTVAP